jgi:hypothetical protein
VLSDGGCVLYVLKKLTTVFHHPEKNKRINKVAPEICKLEFFSFMNSF